MHLQKASRKKAKIKMGLQGPSGSGKTMSSLLIGLGICCDWKKIAVIDTENQSADLYAHLGAYNVLSLSAPIQPGNSGGPLFDKKGNYIGLITSKVTIGENIGYALKTNYLIDFLKRNKISIPNSKQVNISESISQKIEILKKNVISIESIRSF